MDEGILVGFCTWDLIIRSRENWYKDAYMYLVVEERSSQALAVH